MDTTTRNKAFQKSLIYFNLALALLMPSKATAQNADNLPKNPVENTQNKNQSAKDSIKIVYDEYDGFSQKDLEQIRTNIRNTGMDIRYVTKDGYFQLRQNNTYRGFWLENFDLDKQLKEWEADHQKFYSRPAEIDTNHVSIRKYMHSSVGLFNPKRNKITINIPTQEDKAYAISDMMHDEKLTFAEADSAVNELIKLGNDPDYIRIAKEHEKSHAWDNEQGLFKPDLSLNYLTHLEMLTEVKATMTMAGLALQHYKETSDLSHFAYVNCKVDTLELQNDLKAGKGKENPEKYVAKYILDKWMEAHNRSNTFYSTNIFEVAEQDALSAISVNIAETPEMHSEYIRRVQKMFSDVKGLGDVAAVINPDFELNSSLQEKITDHLGKGFTYLMPHGTLQEDMENIKGLLLVIRDLDKKGKRSPKTQAAIDKAIKAFTTPATPKTYDMAQHIKPGTELVK